MNGFVTKGSCENENLIYSAILLHFYDTNPPRIDTLDYNFNEIRANLGILTYQKMLFYVLIYNVVVLQ